MSSSNSSFYKEEEEQDIISTNESVISDESFEESSDESFEEADDYIKDPNYVPSESDYSEYSDDEI